MLFSLLLLMRIIASKRSRARAHVNGALDWHRLRRSWRPRIDLNSRLPPCGTVRLRDDKTRICVTLIVTTTTRQDGNNSVAINFFLLSSPSPFSWARFTVNRARTAKTSPAYSASSMAPSMVVASRDDSFSAGTVVAPVP